MEIADKWIQLGYTAKMVLRIVGILEATYYYRKNKASQKPPVYHGGRPIPGYSLSQDGQPVSDEQIKEWLFELIAAEESAYGYRKLTVCLRRDHQLIINKKKVYRLLKEKNSYNHSDKRRANILASSQITERLPLRINCGRWT